MKLYIILLVVLIIEFGHVLEIRPTSEFSIEESQGFFAYLPVPAEFGEIVICEVSHTYLSRIRPKTVKYKLDMNSTDSIQMESGELILPYSEVVCGVRVENISTLGLGGWALKVANSTNNQYKESFTVNKIFNKLKDEEFSIISFLGERNFQCDKTLEPINCRIHNFANNEIWEGCEKKIIVQNPNTWSCRTLSDGKIGETENIYKIDVKRFNPMAEAEHTETEKYATMTCTFPETQEVQHCRAEMPGKMRQLLIQNGLQSGRFATLYTEYDDQNLKRNCTFIIRKPFLNDDEGIWRIYGQGSSTYGCIFYIGDRSQLIQKVLDVENVEYINITPETKQRDVVCEAPFALDSCILQSPSNELTILPAKEMEISGTLGFCRFGSIRLTDGQWICNMVGKNQNDKKMRKIFQVSTTSNIFGKAIKDIVYAQRDDPVELMCRSGNSLPIFSCAFIDPQSDVHILSAEDSNTSERLKYFGRGFGEGFCGLAISTVRPEDFGYWECHFTTDRNALTTVGVEIYLSENHNVSQASVIGLSVGVVCAIILLIMGIFIYVYKKEIIQKLRVNRIQESNTSSENNFQMSNM